MRTVLVLAALASGVGLYAVSAPAAQAQSLAAPGGTSPATAPGGTMGRAGPRNVRSAIRSGEAYRINRRGRIRKIRPNPR